jgi:Zn-finger protein
MESAKSMRLGGKTVYPDECDFYSYNDLKLRCHVCGEPVYLKKGKYRKPHFAHFPGTDPKQVEECKLRVSNYSNSTEINILIKDKGQRLEVFQQHFLSMISIGEEKIVNDVKFKKWINSIQGTNNPTIKNIIKDCTQYFLIHRRLIADKYILHISKIKDNQTILQQQIALEAIDYLCVKSSLQLLEYLLHYSMYQLYKHEQNKLFKQQITKNDIDTICHHVTKITMFNRWIEAFSNVKDNTQIKTNIIRINKSKNSSDSVQLPIPFICYGGKRLNQVLRYTLEVTSTKPFTVTVYFHSVKRTKQGLENIKTEVFKIESGIGKLTPSFDPIPLEDKLVFESDVDNHTKQFNFHYEVVMLLALPHWIDNASNYVRLNELAPVWLVVSKLWLRTELETTKELDINETKKARKFNEDDWWFSLVDAHQELPDNEQLKLAVSNLPEKYKHLLAPIKVVKNQQLSPLQIFLQDILYGIKEKPTENINSSIINTSHLSRLEREKLKSPLPLYYMQPAIIYNSKRNIKKIIVDCKVITEINSNENTTLQFSYLVNEYIKVDSPLINSSGKRIKADTEIWHPALVYRFSPQFELTIEKHTESLFPQGGYIEGFPYIKTRCELADLFEVSIVTGQVEFIKTIEEKPNKVLISTVYDCSILLLYELLEHCHVEKYIHNKPKYKPIEFNTVMKCVINAANKAVKLGIPLINGMLLHSLFTAANQHFVSDNNI